MPNGDLFYFARRARKLRYYGDVIHSFYWKSAVQHDSGVKMRDTVPNARYYPVCNVLRLLRIWLIPTLIWSLQTRSHESTLQCALQNRIR